MSESSQGESGDVLMPEYELEIDSMDERWVATLNPPEIQKAEFLWIFCLFGFEPWCWRNKYVDPNIDFNANATEISEADVYILSGRITGKIRTVVNNMSSEGEQYEENVKTGEVRNRRTVQGSANIDASINERIIVASLRELLADVMSKVVSVIPGGRKYTGSTFEKRGYVTMIKEIYNILVKGRIYVNETVKVRVSYNWFGRRTKGKDIRITMNLPVKTLRWHAW